MRCTRWQNSYVDPKDTNPPKRGKKHRRRSRAYSSRAAYRATSADMIRNINNQPQGKHSLVLDRYPHSLSPAQLLLSTRRYVYMASIDRYIRTSSLPSVQ
jgi:hypothetical protein